LPHKFTNKMTEIQDIFSFWSFYDEMDVIEKRKLRYKIIEATQVEHTTFYSWQRRKMIPKWHQRQIAEVVGIPTETLFPEIHTHEYSPKTV